MYDNIYQEITLQRACYIFCIQKQSYSKTPNLNNVSYEIEQSCMELCLLSVESPDVSHVETLQLFVITISYFIKVLSLKQRSENAS